jgi:hypothetical protein
MLILKVRIHGIFVAPEAPRVSVHAEVSLFDL